MSTSIPNFKVFVSDEIFDFRTLHGTTMNNKLKTTSNSTCKFDQQEEDNKVDEKISQQKLTKPKPRPRSRTVDPRFRRFTCRTCTCKGIHQMRRNFNKIDISKKGDSPKPPDFITDKELHFMEGNACDYPSNWKDVAKNASEFSRKDEQLGNKTEVLETVSCEQSNIKVNIEELDYSDIVDSLNVDEKTVSKVCLKKPYWEDKRYIANEVLNTKILPHGNLGFLKKKNYPGGVYCHISPYPNSGQEFTAYKYDQGSEVCSCSIIHEEDSGSLKSGVVIVGAKRTAIGTYGGKLKNISACNLQVVSNKAAMETSNIKPDMIDTVNIGNVYTFSAPDGIFIARHAALKSGVSIDKPALQVNRLCGSGFQALINGVQDIKNGMAKVSLTGGTESMSQAPFMLRNIRFGTQFGVNYKVEDALWEGLVDTNCNLSMALTAEKLGEQCNLTRAEVDKFALRSQSLYKTANENGRFKDEIVPVEIVEPRGFKVLEVDEHPRPNTNLEELSKLKSVFKINGLVTAGNASGITDGAGTVIVASDVAAKEYDLKPLARVKAYSIVGVEPSVMGVGPVPAIEKLLEISELNLQDIDLIEASINEAFSAQALSCAMILKLDMNKFNVNGGAIAIGHPLAASGARIITHLVYELRRRKARYGIGSACIGGGQGIAVLIESLG
ncbi:hypothetical protein FQR65_LT06312 [Abscondita terminalis]|nr:hypothetical protein FQR65_LT06312 [Abscondita terminalis]